MPHARKAAEDKPEQPYHSSFVGYHLLHTFENIEKQPHTVRVAGLEQMDAHMNKSQRSKHTEHPSSLPALPCHTKWYSSHIENDNENITFREGCCTRSGPWQMDGVGNMLQHPGPATTLADLSDTKVSPTGELVLPMPTQLLPADPCLHCMDFTYSHGIKALLAPRLTPSQHVALKQRVL